MDKENNRFRKKQKNKIELRVGNSIWIFYFYFFNFYLFFFSFSFFGRSKAVQKSINQVIICFYSGMIRFVPYSESSSLYFDHIFYFLASEKNSVSVASYQIPKWILREKKNTFATSLSQFSRI